jgi:glycosyltransferase involved in cell wall biosynthesis
LSAQLQQLEGEDPLGADHREVVLFTSSYCMGGIEAHLSDLTRGLLRRGWHVNLICSDLVDIEPLRQDMSRIGATVHTVPEAKNWFGLIRRAWRLVRILRMYPGCTVHLHLQGEAGGTLMLVAARLAGAGVVVRTLHNPPVPPISRRHRWLVRLSARFTDRLICVSPETKRTQVQEFDGDPGQFVIIPNGVDLDRFSPMISRDDVRRDLGIAMDDPLIGTVARLQEERKGVSEFIDMAAGVARRWPKARFMVVGDGPLRPALERQAAKLGLTDCFVFTGYRRDVPRLLAAMDVAVFPSSYEAAQYVMLEAMAMALPVVITPAGLAIDLITSGVTGMLVPFRNPPAMCDAVDRLLADGETAKRIGAAGRALIVEGYSTEVMVDAVARLYQELIDWRVPFRTRRPTGVASHESARERYP